MKKILVILVGSLSVIFVVFAIIGNQQLLRYNDQYKVVEQMNAAGPEGREVVCRSLHLPWLARQFDVVTPSAFVALLLLVVTVILQKKLGISKAVVRVALTTVVIGLTIMIVYQFVDPFFPFALCRGLLP